MDELDLTLLHLVRDTCQHSKNSRERQKGLQKIITLIQKSGRLLKARNNIYDIEDAYQKTWLYFCRNLCEACTANQPFNPQEDDVISWVNRYLHFRIKDSLIRPGEPPKVSPVIDDKGQVLDPLELIPAPPDIPPILIEVERWLKQEASQLKKIHIQNRPDINCFVLIQRRLPPETAWKDLAIEFGVSVPTLSSFYQRKCLPCLRNFGKSASYLDED